MKPAEGSSGNPVLEVRRQLYVTYQSGDITYAIGEVVESKTTGYAKHAAAGAAILGIIIGFENANGQLIRPAAVAAGVANVGSIESVTVSDGEVVYAIINASPKAKWLADVSGTLGTTNASDLPGCNVSIDSDASRYDRLKENTAVRNSGSNFYSYGPDVEDPTKLVVGISESELEH
jgi:hypothetical protein